MFNPLMTSVKLEQDRTSADRRTCKRTISTTSHANTIQPLCPPYFLKLTVYGMDTSGFSGLEVLKMIFPLRVSEGALLTILGLT